ncbi:hypothetical protein [Deefgea piscis]|uniref:hypothetical protein n=1 Tax=Deefgea piscis TaxID=2739061 RepID=UPI001C7E352E|nr:hypothetical protein [Deefgea piscis]QZA81792.1 hypothetical protein K4H25_03805 [Deefgea piscis]
MKIVIGNFPPATSSEDVVALLVEQLGAPIPTEITVSEGAGRNVIALVQYPAEAPHTLGDVLANKLNGYHYQGFHLNATVTHNFKD